MKLRQNVTYWSIDQCDEQRLFDQMTINEIYIYGITHAKNQNEYHTEEKKEFAI